MRVKNPESTEVLVNKRMWLPKEYIPEPLVCPKIKFLPDVNPEAMLLRKDAAKALEKMIKRAEKEKIRLYGVSGYRSFERQREIFKHNFACLGEAANKYSARPGQSEHQTGLAIDVTCESNDFLLKEEFAVTEEYTWLMENCRKYGFIIRYPKGKEEITGYNFEPWHLRFLGEKTAKEVGDKNITLEEYFSENNVGL